MADDILLLLRERNKVITKKWKEISKERDKRRDKNFCYWKRQRLVLKKFFFHIICKNRLKETLFQQLFVQVSGQESFCDFGDCLICMTLIHFAHLLNFFFSWTNLGLVSFFSFIFTKMPYYWSHTDKKQTNVWDIDTEHQKEKNWKKPGEFPTKKRFFSSCSSLISLLVQWHWKSEKAGVAKPATTERYVWGV